MMTKLQRLHRKVDEARLEYSRKKQILDIELGRLKLKLEEGAPETAYIRVNHINMIFADGGSHVIKYTRGQNGWNVTHSGKELPDNIKAWHENILRVLETE
jgi:hypothetical protein